MCKSTSSLLLTNSLDTEGTVKVNCKENSLVNMREPGPSGGKNMGSPQPTHSDLSQQIVYTAYGGTASNGSS